MYSLREYLAIEFYLSIKLKYEIKKIDVAQCNNLYKSKSLKLQ